MDETNLCAAQKTREAVRFVGEGERIYTLIPHL
jgi:hypothetical protein